MGTAMLGNALFFHEI